VRLSIVAGTRDRVDTREFWPIGENQLDRGVLSAGGVGASNRGLYVQRITEPGMQRVVVSTGSEVCQIFVETELLNGAHGVQQLQDSIDITAANAQQSRGAQVIARGQVVGAALVHNQVRDSELSWILRVVPFYSLQIRA
jgi:hypothetical protein